MLDSGMAYARGSIQTAGVDRAAPLEQIASGALTLLKQLDELEARLTPVLALPPPAIAQNMEPKSQPYNQLQEVRATVEAASHRLGGILQRIEL